MTNSTHFIQDCPTCGRKLQVRLVYLGKQVSCRHCHAQFLAIHPMSPAHRLSDSGLDLLRRADELLARADQTPAGRQPLPPSA